MKKANCQQAANARREGCEPHRLAGTKQIQLGLPVMRFPGRFDEVLVVFCLAVKKRSGRSIEIVKPHRRCGRSIAALFRLVSPLAGRTLVRGSEEHSERRLRQVAEGCPRQVFGRGCWTKWRDGPVTSLYRGVCRQIIPGLKCFGRFRVECRFLGRKRR
jgi:hypothetical protein